MKSEQKDFLLADLYEFPVEGVTEIDQDGERVELTAFFAEAAEANAASQQFATHEPLLEECETVDWVTVSQEHWEPIRIGKRLFLAPDWREDPTPTGLIRLPGRAGRACGSGAHPCTQLCLAALDTLVQTGSSVLDVGAGSGLLSLAAIRLGAAKVIACDTDPEAVEIARENFATDHVAPLVFVGTADSVKSESVQLIVANISAAVDSTLAPEWRRILVSGGTAILSGFERNEVDPVRSALHRERLQIVAEHEDSGWVCLIAAKA